MKRLKLNHLVILVLGLAILLVFNTMGIFAYRDAVLSAETRKNNMLNLAVKYTTLIDNLNVNAQSYIFTNDERHRTDFYLLRNEFIYNNNISLKYRTFTEAQASGELKKYLQGSGFTLSDQVQYLAFNKEEKKIYSLFLASYMEIIDRLTFAVAIRDSSILSDEKQLELKNSQDSYFVDLSSMYINRLNEDEDAILFYQQILEVTLVFISLFLLICCISTYYAMIRANRFQSYFRQLYTTLVENINVGIAVLDHNNNFVYTNSMYREIMSVKSYIPEGELLRNVLSQNVSDIIMNLTSKRSKDSGEVDMVIGGYKKHIAYDYFTINDENGNKRVVHLIQDFTNMEDMQNQLLDHVKEIEYYSKAKDSFIANISHEIKTPIHAILGMVHFLKSTRLSENQKNLIRKIEASSDILLSIISDVLDLSKVKNRSLSLYPSDFSLGQALKGVEDMFIDQLNEKGISLLTEYNFDKSLCIHLDRTRFVQVLVNLINNAYKFTESGYIRLHVEIISENPESVQLQFCIEDTGLGIAEDDISKLFREFGQLENHLTKQHKGTGLGLYICKNIVENMGGRLWVNSIKGKGSKFYFTLPSEKCHKPPLSSPSNGSLNESSLDGQGCRILVVEDTEINMEVAIRLLNDVNIMCDSASNGLDAIQMCKNHSEDYYKVILMDIHMPKMDGYTAATVIRNELGYNTPIIAFTASFIDQDVRIKYQGIIDDFILKPFKASAFYRAIAIYFEPQNSGEFLPTAPTNKHGYFNGTISTLPDAMTRTGGCEIDTAQELAHKTEKEDPFAGRTEAIKNLGGLEPIYNKHVQKFKTNYHNSAEHIRELLAEDDYDAARRMAHSIKGLGGTLGMLGLQSAAGALEKAILKGSSYDLSVELEDFDEELAAVIAAI